MEKLWEENIRRVEPYVPGEQPKSADVIKLNTNENPYPPAPSVLKLAGELSWNPMRRYPDPCATELVEALAAQYGLKPEQIFVGVGSDDVLSMCFLTYFYGKKPILFPDITYSFYSVWAEVYRIPYERPVLDENFNIRAEDYYRENGGVVIANPNAPTSIYRDLDFIRDILDHNRDVIVIVDEAYIDFAGPSAVSLLEEYDNLVVVQTYSKSRSMAGLRVGYAMASPELIRCLNDVKYSVNSYTMNYPSIRLGAEAARCVEYYRETAAKIVATRERTVKELAALGFTCLPSGANFVFARHEKKGGNEIFTALREHNVYVRHFHGDRIEDYLRITIGTDEEMDRLFALLRDIL